MWDKFASMNKDVWKNPDVTREQLFNFFEDERLNGKRSAKDPSTKTAKQFDPDSISELPDIRQVSVKKGKKGKDSEDVLYIGKTKVTDFGLSKMPFLRRSDGSAHKWLCAKVGFKWNTESIFALNYPCDIWENKNDPDYVVGCEYQSEHDALDE